MTFGEVAVEDAVGALSVHGVRAGDVVLRKGQTVSAEVAHALREAGLSRIVAARLEPGDVGEDEAALRLARAAAGPHVRVEPPFTGRANLFAEQDGVLALSPDRVHAANGVDEAITLATLPAFKPVVAGEMVGTVKIIPYGVPEALLDRAVACAGPGPAVSVAPYVVRRVGVVSTLTPGFKETVVAKTVGILADRLRPSGATVAAEATCRHETASLRDALLAQVGGVEMIVVFGASAIADRRDVIPAAIEAACGQVEHLGMPVDPGNLLLLGSLGGKPVIGAPGCARSPKENGFDWLLARLLAGLPVTGRDIARLGVGGLLTEIVSRGQPRAGSRGQPRTGTAGDAGLEGGFDFTGEHGE